MTESIGPSPHQVKVDDPSFLPHSAVQHVLRIHSVSAALSSLRDACQRRHSLVMAPDVVMRIAEWLLVLAQKSNTACCICIRFTWDICLLDCAAVLMAR